MRCGRSLPASSPRRPGQQLCHCAPAGQQLCRSAGQQHLPDGSSLQRPGQQQLRPSAQASNNFPMALRCSAQASNIFQMALRRCVPAGHQLRRGAPASLFANALQPATPARRLSAAAPRLAKAPPQRRSAAPLRRPCQQQTSSGGEEYSSLASNLAHLCRIC